MKKYLQTNIYSIIFFVAFFGLVLKGNAQTVQINANPGQSGNIVIGLSNYHVSESIYTEAELGAANFISAATAINHIDFNVFALGTPTTVTNFNIYLKEVPSTTTLLAVGAYSTSGYTLVYSGAYNASIIGWAGVDFTTNFVRTPGNNLEVLIERTDGIIHGTYSFRSANGNNTNATALTSRRVNQTALPVSGTTVLSTATAFRPQIQLRHINTNDAAINQIYTLGKLPIPFATPHVISANIINNGTNAQTNLPVTLNIAGANIFSDIKIIPSIPPGASATVSFAAFSPVNTGDNVVSVSIPADDFTGDNSLSVNQEVTNNSYTYAYGTTPSSAVGFNGSTADLVAKFTTSSPTSVNQVGVNFLTGGQPFQIAIWDKSGLGLPGNLLWESTPQTTTAGVFTLPVSPAVAITDTFYVGVRQIGTVNIQFAYQTETPIRSNTFFVASPSGSTAWSDFAPANPFKFMIEPRLTIANDVGVSNIFNPLSATLIDNCGILPQAVISNFGSADQPSFDVTFNIKQSGVVVYSNTKNIALTSGSSQQVTFNSFVGSVSGIDSAFCFTSLVADGSRINDTVVTKFTTNNYSYGGGAVANGGYLFANSTTCASPSVFQPTYNWITETSNEINWSSNGDDSTFATAITLPFSFPFFINNYSQLWINSNGWISFTNPAALTAAVQRTPVTIPTAGGIDNYIAGFLNDLDNTPGAFPDAHTYYGGNTSQFVVTFLHAHLFGSATDFISFQIILKPDGNIFVQFNEAETSIPLPNALTNSCAIGIENAAGTQGILYRLNGNFGPVFGSPLALQYLPPTPVPLTLLNFAAQKNNGFNKISWTTTQEINTSFFAVERSSDGINFTTIGQVTAAGNSSTVKQYIFNDISPLKPLNYYRLKMTDRDNSFKYSDIKIIRNDGTIDITVYPNPVKDKLILSFSSEKNDQYNIAITDIGGQTVLRKNGTVTTGTNNIELNGNQLASGAYVVKIELNGQVIFKKFNKL